MSRELVDKILSRTVADANGCWIWQGAKTRKGYGVVCVPGVDRNTYTHRTMYEDACGVIPEGMQIDHLCRNPPCCNPEHLEAVTPAENTKRGQSRELAALRRNSASHCVHGHPYTDDNTYIDGRGYRSCRKCRHIRHQEWGEKRRSKRAGYRDFTAHSGNVTPIRMGAKL